MPAPSDWTTSVLTEEIGNHYRKTLVQVSGDGTMSYNSSGCSGQGLCLPALGSLGMRRNLEYVKVVGYASESAAGARIWKYDKTVTNVATGADSFNAVDLSPGGLRAYVANTTASITSFGTSGGVGIIAEVPSGVVVTTGTLYLECYGW